MTTGSVPASPSRTTPRISANTLLWGVLLIASILPLIAATQSIGRLNDDSYITLTYVKSLIAGEGWRYNGGTEALGTTTPLFALIVTVGSLILPFLSIEQVAVGWSLLCWWGVGWIFPLGYRTWGLKQHEGQLIGLILLLQGGYWFATLGMEAAFLLAGVLWTTWQAARGNSFTSGIAAGLLFLIRPEGLAMVPLVGGWLLWHNRATWQKTLLRFVAGVAIPLGLWAIYAWLTFGAILPNSASAKLEQGDKWGGITFTQRLLTEWLPGHFRAYGITPFISALIPLGLTGIAVAIGRARPLLIPLIWIGLFLTAYTLLEAPPYWWYMLPILFGIQLVVGLGWGALLRIPNIWAKSIVMILLVAFLGTVGYRNINGLMNLQGDQRAEEYKGLATWLNTNTPPDSTVAYVEIGYLGYFGDRPIVDLIGLVDPRYRTNGATLDVDANFWEAEPDYFVYVADFAWMMGDIVNHPDFATRYRLAAELPSPFTMPLQVYQKTNSLP
jgi:MFS family permease